MILLNKIWKPIERGLKFIGKIQSAIILSVFYFLILGLVAIPYSVVQALSSHPKKRLTYWQPREVDDGAGLLRQF